MVSNTQEIDKIGLYPYTRTLYAGIEEQKDGGELFEQKMGRLTKELFRKAH